MQSALSSRSHLRLPLDRLQNSLGGRIAIVVAASVFVALCAHVSFPLPFTPVPTTLQTFAVILVGLLLGPAAGFATMLLYLAEGASGLPVFSPHGPGGIAQLLGPTAGYLFSYPLCAACAGAVVKLLRGRVPAPAAAIVAGVLASLPVFIMGAAWLAHLTHVSASTAIHLGVTPFLAGEAVKIAGAAVVWGALARAQR